MTADRKMECACRSRARRFTRRAVPRHQPNQVERFPPTPVQRGGCPGESMSSRKTLPQAQAQEAAQPFRPHGVHAMFRAAGPRTKLRTCQHQPRSRKWRTSHVSQTNWPSSDNRGRIAGQMAPRHLSSLGKTAFPRRKGSASPGRCSARLLLGPVTIVGIENSITGNFVEFRRAHPVRAGR